MFGIMIDTPTHELTMMQSEDDPKVLIVVITIDGHPIGLQPIQIRVSELEVLLEAIKNGV